MLAPPLAEFRHWGKGTALCAAFHEVQPLIGSPLLPDCFARETLRQRC